MAWELCREETHHVPRAVVEKAKEKEILVAEEDLEMEKEQAFRRAQKVAQMVERVQHHQPWE